MDSQDKSVFAREMATLSELYGKTVSKELFEMYCADLSEYRITDIVRAVQAHRRDPDRGRYFPKPADLLDKIQCSAEEAALIAWSEVPRLAANSREAKSQDDVTESVVQDMGGWRRFGMADAKEMHWMQREFVERYKTIKRTGFKRIGNITPIGGLLK